MRTNANTGLSSFFNEPTMTAVASASDGMRDLTLDSFLRVPFSVGLGGAKDTSRLGVSLSPPLETYKGSWCKTRTNIET
jgi:hypothetical protein